MTTIHWVGAGLSSAPGILRLTRGDLPVVLWNRTIDKARALAAKAPGLQARAFDESALSDALQPGDILISMLPGDWHPRLAQLAIDKDAHFVSSSYIAPELRSLDDEARRRGLCLVNEVGLDPGIDHLMAHVLVEQYRASGCHDSNTTLAFRSYCGGFPAISNDFRYKFSWSPLGVLRALKSPARCISGGLAREVQRPWHAISNYTARLTGGDKSFEAYPNRDSLPFMQQYHFDPGWQVAEFVRGTLRLAGWSSAWEPLFREIEQLEGSEGEARLAAISDDLWRDYQYEDGEPDWVVLVVELEARNQEGAVWHKGYSLDARGTAAGSAMARLVSLTVSLAVDAIAAGEISPGVSAGPDTFADAERWLQRLNALGEAITYHDHLVNPGPGKD